MESVLEVASAIIASGAIAIPIEQREFLLRLNRFETEDGVGVGDVLEDFSGIDRSSAACFRIRQIQAHDVVFGMPDGLEFVHPIVGGATAIAFDPVVPG